MSVSVLYWKLTQVTRLVLLFKIVNDLVAIPADNNIEYNQRPSRASNSKQIKVLSATTGEGPTLYLNSRTASTLRRYRLFLFEFLVAMFEVPSDESKGKIPGQTLCRRLLTI
jgi:hypothetical protein